MRSESTLSRVAGWGALVVLSILVGGAVGKWSILGAGAAVGVVAFAAAAIRPKLATYFVVVFGVLQYLFTKSYAVLPLAVTVLDDVVLAGVLVRSLVDILSGRRRFGSPLVLAALAVWVGSGVANSILRGGSLSLLVLALRGIALPAAVLLAAGLYFDERTDRERIRWAVIGICTFHAGLSIVQWLGAPARFDVGYGVLGPGGANSAGFLDLIGLVWLLAKPLERRHWVIAAVLMMSPIASSSRAAIYVLPLAVFIVLLSRNSLSRGLARAMGAVSIAGMALWGYSVAVGRGLEELAVGALFKSQFIAGQGGRLLYVAALPQVLHRDPVLWLFGLGPGNFTSYVGVGTLVPAFQLVAFTRSDAETGYAYPDIEWAALLGEYGIVGTAAVVTMLTAPVVRWFRRREVLIAMQDVTIALPAVMVIILVAMTTLNVLEVQPLAYVGWLTAGLIYSLPEPPAGALSAQEAPR